MDVKILERDDVILAYIPETLRFFEINGKTKEIIEELNNKSTDEEIIEKCRVTANQLAGLKNLLSKKREKTEKKNVTRMGLSKLVLNISNACNLRCKYCYANGGNYKSDERMMSVDVAKDALDLFFEKFKAIDTIQLFGGEPLLNRELMDFVCEYVKEISPQTRIGLVTNGTLIDDDFIKLVKKYNIMVTVSYDGVPLVNDIMRITKYGEGTSDIILENIKKLHAETKEPSTIEVTFNQMHVNNNVSIADVISFVRKNLGDIPLHITPAGGNKSCNFVLKNRSAFVDVVEDIFENKEGLNMFNYSLVQRIVGAIYNHGISSDYICAAGLSCYSVSVDGDIYPCFMFTDDVNMCMGNIYDENVFEQPKFIQMFNRLRAYSKNDIEQCKKCFIKESCTGCLGINLLETGSVFELNEETCEMYRGMTEEVIYHLYKRNKEKKSEIA
jgi:uncharacterized protein